MTSRGAGRRPAWLVAAAMSASSICNAGTWGADPMIGVVGYHSTNPDLLVGSHTVETREALVLDGPTSYKGDAVDFSILPSFRVGDSVGYSSLTSNYEHLTFKGDLKSERDIFAASAGAARDSSLYYNFTQNGLAGVSRESATADASWSRHLTERLAFDADVNESRVRYGRALGAATLVDYSYGVFAPSLSWDASERNKLSLTGGASLYKSLDGTTKSTNLDLQVGFQRRLSEIWSVASLVGFSRSSNTLDTVREYLVFTANGPAIVTTPIQIKSSQNSTVYSVSLTRQAELLVLTAGASRQLVPSGFAFLSRQQTYELNAAYPRTDRWKLSADLRWLKSQDPSRQGAYAQRTVRYVSISSAWQWTEHWTITFGASRVMENLPAIGPSPSSTDVSIQLSRQFNRIKF
jgi:hypothetical protein